MVVNAVNSPNIVVSKFGEVIQKCREVLALNPNFVVKFVGRQANVVAHSLARVATSWPSPHIFDLLPSCISDAIMNDIL